ncbi:MAG: hypothetical protein ACFE0J_13220 [Elainellaceae cyanobacterium]
MLPPLYSSVTDNNYAIQETKSIYWRRLIEVGVPVEAANMIAWAIAYYDVAKELPTAQQRALISYYCRFICRAELWRRQLLLHSAFLG